jgi:hypothetical protein
MSNEDDDNSSVSSGDKAMAIVEEAAVPTYGPSLSIAETSANSATSSAGKRKRTRRGPTEEMRVILEHFVSAGARHNNQYHICRYCNEHYERQLGHYAAHRIYLPPKSPTPMRQRMDTLRKHLDSCKYYKAHLQQESVGWTAPSTLVVPHSIDANLSSEQSLPHLRTSTPMSSSTISTDTDAKRAPVPSVKQHSLSQHFLTRLNEEQTHSLHTLLIEFIVDTALPFSVVERGSFKRLVNFLRPGAHQQVLGRITMSTNVLEGRNAEAVARREENIKKLQEKGQYIALLVDGWETCRKTPLEGIMIKAGALSFLLTAITPPSTDSHGIAVAKMWEHVFNTAAQPYVPRLRYFLSDDASYCARAREILAIRHPQIVFTKCWAHQVNLMVGHLMRLPTFKEVCNAAAKAAIAIRSSHSKWYAKLRQICIRLYGHKAASTLFSLAETRWNSLQAMFASQLRIRQACKLLYYEGHALPRWPAACNVWPDTTFWHNLEEAELLIRPFCDSSFLMQREANTVADVFVMLVNLYTHILDYHGSQEDSLSLTRDISTRWERVEQPLYLLAFCLHPKYKNVAIEILRKSELRRGKYKDTRNNITAARLADAACFYYRKHLLFGTTEEEDNKKELKKLRLAVFLWLKGQHNNNQDLFAYHASMDPSEWFDLNEDILGVEISNLAKFLLGMPSQGASCERLFKDFSRYLTKARNRLSDQNLVKTTMIKYDMKDKYPTDHCCDNVNMKGSHRNRFIDPTEHKRLDGSATTEAEVTLETESDPALEDDDDDELLESDLAALEDDSGYDVVGLRAVLAAIQRSAPQDDMMEDDEQPTQIGFPTQPDSNLDDSDDDDIEAIAARHTAAVALERVEDPPEKCIHPLQPLPDDNVVDFPQENRAYFARKNYVRNDKYALGDFTFEGVTFPSIMDAFV